MKNGGIEGEINNPDARIVVRMTLCDDELPDKNVFFESNPSCEQILLLDGVESGHPVGNVYPRDYMKKSWTKKMFKNEREARTISLIQVSRFHVNVAVPVTLPLSDCTDVRGSFQIGARIRGNTAEFASNILGKGMTDTYNDGKIKYEFITAEDLMEIVKSNIVGKAAQTQINTQNRTIGMYKNFEDWIQGSIINDEYLKSIGVEFLQVIVSFEKSEVEKLEAFMSKSNYEMQEKGLRINLVIADAKLNEKLQNV